MSHASKDVLDRRGLSHWTMAGGLFLASAGLLPAARDLIAAEAGTEATEYLRVPTARGPSSSRVRPVRQPANPPARESAREPTPAPAIAPIAEPNSDIVSVDESCPPVRTGPLRRWHERCKAHKQDTLWGYPEEFEDAPFGAAMQSHLATQIANGRAARMVLYQYDFFPGTDRLKPRGRIQLAKMVEWLPLSAIIVEPSGAGPTLDEARRQMVLRELASEDFQVPVAQVFVGRPLRRGIEGFEGTLLDRNLSNQTNARGIGPAGGSGTSGTSTTPSTQPSATAR